MHNKFNEWPDSFNKMLRKTERFWIIRKKRVSLHGYLHMQLLWYWKMFLRR